MRAGILQDLRFAWRLALRQPLVSAAAALTLALGIGSTTALFSVVHAWLLAPLPFHDPQRLVMVWETIPSASIFENTPAPASVLEWRKRTSAFEALAPWTQATVNLTGDGEPAQLTTVLASRELLPALGVAPLIGRNFDRAEGTPNGPRAALLTFAFWKARFGADPAVVGRTLILGDKATTVIGVLPQEVSLPDVTADVWQPLAFTAAEEQSGNRFLWVLGRLTAAATSEEASRQVDAVMKAQSDGKLGARVVPLREQTVGPIGHDALVLFGATAFVLLIACANVASLTLARITGRRQELVVRTALGASRRRLMRQVLTESLMLAAAGGIAGFILAAWTVRAVVALTPQADALPPVTIASPWVFLFALAAATLTSVVFGIVPAWNSSSVQPGAAMQTGSRSVVAGGGRLLRGIVAAEVALALALLVGATLVMRSYEKLTRVDLGFQPHGLLAFQVPRATPASALVPGTAFYEEMLRGLRAVPGIRSAAVTQALPLRSSCCGSGFRVEGRTGDDASILSYWRTVSADYFTTMGIPLRAGRTFEPRDRDGAGKVAIVTESFARRAWPDGKSIGRRIGWGTLAEPLTVVGVAGDIKLSRAGEPGPHVYMPFTQVPDRLPQDLVVRADLSTAAAIEAVRSAIRTLDRNQPVAGIATMDALLERTMGRRRFQLALFSLFAGVSGLLAMIGIYGVLSYVVGQMSQELGLRLALGATRGAITWRILRLGLTTTIAGIAIGSVLAALGATLVRSFLFGIDARDPLTFGLVAVLLTTAALAACLLPARRAAAIDPIVALRRP